MADKLRQDNLQGIQIMREKLLQKKYLFIVVLMIIMMSIFCGCGGPEQQETEVPDDEAVTVFEEYISEIERYETPDGIFREENRYVMVDGDFKADIVYPVTGNEGVDREILSYVQHAVSRYNREAGGNIAELTMKYEGYIVNKQYMGVKMTGVFDGPFMAHPEDILKTFNGMADGGIVKIGDVIAAESREELIEMTANATGADHSLIDDGFLDNWNLTGRGLEITLERGKYGPMSDGTRSVLFTYAELGSRMTADIDTRKTIRNETTEQIIAPADKVTVPELHRPDPDKPMIALTFDDGPGAYTDRLLDIFQEHGGHATFFLLGNKIDKRPETVQRMVEEGHEVAGHSWSHQELTKLTEKEIRSQLVKTNNKINELTGLTPVIMRPPYGSYNDNVRAVAKKLGLSAINWNVDTLDWKYKDADYVYDAAMKKLKDGNIILFHDIHPTTVDAMEQVIPALIEEGYQLVTVSQLLTADGSEIVPGALYYNR